MLWHDRGRCDALYIVVLRTHTDIGQVRLETHNQMTGTRTGKPIDDVRLQALGATVVALRISFITRIWGNMPSLAKAWQSDSSHGYLFPPIDQSHWKLDFCKQRSGDTNKE